MYEIYAYGNNDSLYGIFNAIAAIMGANSYLQAIAMVAFCGFVTAALAYAFMPHKLIGWQWLASVLLVYSILFVPKVTVGIVDKLGTQPVQVVSNVPFGVAFFENGLKLTTLDMFHNSDPEECYEQGRKIIAHETWALERVYNTAQQCTIADIPAVIVQSPTWCSELGNYMLEHSTAHIAIVTRWDFRTNKHFVSLRSRPVSSQDHINVATLCAQFGGGGHPCAAGFSAETLSMIKFE